MNPDEVRAKYSELYSNVIELRNSGKTAIESIKEIREVGNISLSEAKRIYVAAVEKKSLEEHEEKIWDELIPILENIDGISVSERNIE